MGSSAVSLRGDLAAFAPELLFQLISQAQASGVLTLQEQSHQVRVWFATGHLRFATGDLGRTDGRLGDTLIRAGKLGKRDRDNAMRAWRRMQGEKGAKRLGAILVERGLIEHADLERFVRKQIKDLIFEVLRWQSGEFRFESGVDVDSEDIVLDVQLDSLLLECMARIDHAERQQEGDA